MKFNLIVNSEQQDGFKLSIQADNEKELAVCKALTTLLIDKITKIEVKVQNGEY